MFQTLEIARRQRAPRGAIKVEQPLDGESRADKDLDAYDGHNSSSSEAEVGLFFFHLLPTSLVVRDYSALKRRPRAASTPSEARLRGELQPTSSDN